MRWPWQREHRETGSDLDSAVAQLIEAQAAGTVADTSSTAAIEAAAGLLARAFAAAQVDADSWVQETVTPAVLAQIGRDVIRQGASMHAIRMLRGQPVLIPAASWHWEGNHDPATWRARVTAYGPSTSTTWTLPAAAVVFMRWGSKPGQTYVGTGPLRWASTTARLQAESEKSLADESGGPLAQIIAIPDIAGTDENHPASPLETKIKAARGKAITAPTTAAAWGEGMSAAPRKDWVAERLGPHPPDSMVNLSDGAFARMLAACGCSPALFDDSDGTAKREALRQWHLGTVQPLARILEHELTAKLAAPVRLQFDLYNMDLQGRATAFQKLVAGGMAIDAAVAVTGLLSSDAAV